MADILVSSFKNKCLEKDILNMAISISKPNDRVVVDVNIKTGIVILKSDLTIYINKGITITASSNINDFSKDNTKELNLVTRPTWEDCMYDGAPSRFFFYGNSIKNFTIEGEGTIDGNEEIFYGRVTKHHIEGKFYPRVPMIYLINSSNISINNVTLTKSGFWTVHLVGCCHVIVDNVKILNSLIFANCDGVDIDSSCDVIVRNSTIIAADDCIVLKSTKEGKKYGDCHNIRGYNNTLTSTSAAIKIGSETESNFYDIKFKNNKIIDSNRGISFQLRDSGNIYDCSFEDTFISTKHSSPLEWWGKAEPIFISSNRRYKNTTLGYIKDITFKNISIDSENSIFLYGDISNVSFDNISMRLCRKTEYELKVHDIRPSEEVNHPFESPLNLIYIDGAKNITFNSFNYYIEDNIKEFIDNNYFVINSNEIKINGKSY